ncbi:LANO_0G04742g1_1 [Lachancea nothofagi CBS 11611]|uniref:LANO_0G04742g1_1 n=1 Tax=Lachancea nothofagi CBS 11611 TaxID=1266666 RepID=A0A1G4KG64_9SACH|nr:LANO_0G04742g1_1 [Lachancea nothofagi CBS 11611]
MARIYSLNDNDIVLGLVAFLLPPLPVLIRSGFGSRNFWINILLCCLFGFPGVFHSMYIVYTTSSEHPSYARVNGDEDLEAQIPPAITEVTKTPETEEPSLLQESPPLYNEVADHNAAVQAATDNKIQH